MTTEDYVTLFASFMIQHIPMITIASIGLWFSISRKQLLGRVSTWATWGFTMLIVYGFCGAALRLALTAIRVESYSRPGGVDPEALFRINLWSLAAFPLFFIGLAVIARAVFLDRGDTDGQAVHGNVSQSAT